jgi:hypothetical protein
MKNKFKNAPLVALAYVVGVLSSTLAIPAKTFTNTLDEKTLNSDSSNCYGGP